MTPSASAGAAISVVPRPHADALATRVVGVIRAPRATLEAVAATPRYAGVLAFTFLVSASCGALLLQTEVGQLALVDQWERTAAAFGRPVNDAQFAALAGASQYGAVYAIVGALVSGPLVAVGLAALVMGALRAAPGPAPGYRQVLAVVAHAGVILALRQAVAAPVSYARETLGSPASLTLFVPMLDEGSMAARLFGIVDLFVIWWLIVVATGLSILYRRPALRLAFVLVGAYLALALVLAIVMAVAGGLA